MQNDQERHHQARQDVKGQTTNALCQAAAGLETQGRERLQDATGVLADTAEANWARRQLAAANDLRDYAQLIGENELPGGGGITYSHTKLQVLTRLAEVGGQGMQDGIAADPLQRAAAARLEREGMIRKSVTPNRTVVYQLARCHRGEPGEPIPGRPPVLTRGGQPPTNPHCDPRVTANPDGSFTVKVDKTRTDHIAKDPTFGWGHHHPDGTFTPGPDQGDGQDPTPVLNLSLAAAEHAARAALPAAATTPEQEILADARVTVRTEPTGARTFSVATDPHNHLLDAPALGYASASNPDVHLVYDPDTCGRQDCDDPVKVVQKLLHVDDTRFAHADELVLRAHTTAHADTRMPDRDTAHRADALYAAAKDMYTDTHSQTLIHDDPRVRETPDGILVDAMGHTFAIKPLGYVDNTLYRSETDPATGAHTWVQVGDETHLYPHHTARDLTYADTALRSADAQRQGALALQADLADLPETVTGTDLNLDQAALDMNQNANNLQEAAIDALADIGAGAHANDIANANAAARGAQPGDITATWDTENDGIGKDSEASFQLTETGHNNTADDDGECAVDGDHRI